MDEIIHDNICSLIHMKCHPESHHGDIKYHMTPNIVFSVDYLHLKDFLKYECEVYLRQPLTPSKCKIIVTYLIILISRDNRLCQFCCYNVVEMRHTLC
jgi:hypothetical protein